MEKRKNQHCRNGTLEKRVVRRIFGPKEKM
jgi:hypothetical protein